MSKMLSELLRVSVFALKQGPVIVRLVDEFLFLRVESTASLSRYPLCRHNCRELLLEACMYILPTEMRNQILSNKKKTTVYS